MPRLAFIERIRDFSSRLVRIYDIKSEYALYAMPGNVLTRVAVCGSNPPKSGSRNGSRYLSVSACMELYAHSPRCRKVHAGTSTYK